MGSLLRFVWRAYQEHTEFRVLVWIAAAVGACLLAIDVRSQRVDWDGILVEAHGMFLDVIILGLLATAFLYHRERLELKPAADVCYAQMLSIVDRWVGALWGASGTEAVYFFGEHAVFSSTGTADINDAALTLSRIDASEAGHLDSMAGFAIDTLEALLDSRPLAAEPELVAATILLSQNLRLLRQALIDHAVEFERADEVRRRVRRAASHLGSLLHARADRLVAARDLPQFVRSGR